MLPSTMSCCDVSLSTEIRLINLQLRFHANSDFYLRFYKIILYLYHITLYLYIFYLYLFKNDELIINRALYFYYHWNIYKIYIINAT